MSHFFFKNPNATILIDSQFLKLKLLHHHLSSLLLPPTSQTPALLPTFFPPTTANSFTQTQGSSLSNLKARTCLLGNEAKPDTDCTTITFQKIKSCVRTATATGIPKETKLNTLNSLFNTNYSKISSILIQ